MSKHKRKNYSHIHQQNNARKAADKKSFERFMAEHNAEVAGQAPELTTIEEAEAEMDRAAAEDFAERHLIRMRRALGVIE